MINLAEIFYAFFAIIKCFFTLYFLSNHEIRHKHAKIKLVTGFVFVLLIFILAEISWILNYNEMMESIDEVMWIIVELGFITCVITALKCIKKSV